MLATAAPYSITPYPAASDGARLKRVELKSVFRLTSYVLGRRSARGDLVLFDHLFTYLVLQSFV